MWNITYGGTLRKLKGRLAETLCEDMIKQAWENLNGDPGRLNLDRRMYYLEDSQGNRYAT